MRDHRRESETVGENLAYLRDKKGELTESRIRFNINNINGLKF